MIAYETPDGGVAIIAGGANAGNMRFVPEGATYAFVESLPDKAKRAGWTLQNGQVVVDEARIPVPDAKPLQLVEELEARGLISTFMGLLTAIEQVKFTSASIIFRADPRVAQMGPALGLDAAGIDDLFREAAKR